MCIRDRAAEAAVDSILICRKWSLRPLQHRLAQGSFVDSEPVSKKLIELTNGWPVLLDQIFEAEDDQDDLRPAAENLSSQLSDDDCSHSFLEACGVNVDSSCVRVAELAYKLGGELVVELDKDGLETVAELLPADQITAPQDVGRAIAFLDRMGCLEEREHEYLLDPILQKVMSAKVSE